MKKEVDEKRWLPQYCGSHLKYFLHRILKLEFTIKTMICLFYSAAHSFSASMEVVMPATVARSGP